MVSQPAWCRNRRGAGTPCRSDSQPVELVPERVVARQQARPGVPKRCGQAAQKTSGGRSGGIKTHRITSWPYPDCNWCIGVDQSAYLGECANHTGLPCWLSLACRGPCHCPRTQSVGGWVACLGYADGLVCNFRRPVPHVCPGICTEKRSEPHRPPGNASGSPCDRCLPRLQSLRTKRWLSGNALSCGRCGQTLKISRAGAAYRIHAVQHSVHPVGAGRAPTGFDGGPTPEPA